MDDKFVKFFLDSKKSIIEFETIEISHPVFDQTYYFVRNSSYGITASLENEQEVHFQYMPMRVTPSTTKSDLDFGVDIVFGDLGDTITRELKKIRISPFSQTRPQLVYRSYRSDDLSSPMNGPFVLEIGSIQFNREGSAFSASPPTINTSRTGTIYTTQRFKGLRGL